MKITITAQQGLPQVPGSSVTITDGDGDPIPPLTETDLQSIIQQILDLIDEASVTVEEVDSSPSIAAATILVPDGTLDAGGTTATLRYIGSRAGARQEVQTITASGAAQTLDLSLYNTFDITLTANCTLTFSNPPPTGVDAHWTLILRQGGVGSFTVTWPGTVAWQDPTDGTTGGSAPTLWTAVGAQDDIEISTVDGGTSYGGTFAPHPTPATAIEVLDEGVSLTSALASMDFVGAGVTATAVGDDVTVTIPGGTSPSDTAGWIPILDGATGAVLQDGGTGQAVMGYATF